MRWCQRWETLANQKMASAAEASAALATALDSSEEADAPAGQKKTGRKPYLLELRGLLGDATIAKAFLAKAGALCEEAQAILGTGALDPGLEATRAALKRQEGMYQAMTRSVDTSLTLVRLLQVRVSR